MRRGPGPWSGLAAGFAAALLIASPVLAAKRGPGGHGIANPSALIATEVALGQMAAKKGQAKALRAFAADEASPLQPLVGKRAAAQVWISCDGSLGVTRGDVKGPDNSVGTYVTVWRRQKNGTYRWVLDQTGAPGPASDDFAMITARIAACPPRSTAPAANSGAGDKEAGDKEAGDKAVVVTAPLANGGTSDDGTLAWSARGATACDRVVSVRLRQPADTATAAALTPVLAAQFASPGCGA